MKKAIIILKLVMLVVLLSSFSIQKQETFSLTVEVNDLRNSEGTVLFALYNREDAFPDQNYKKHFKKLTGKIINGASSVTFENLPAGKYAVNILHDENNDGKIKKGLIMPKEGIGFSNYKSIGLSNRPSFRNSSFNILNNKKVKVDVIYF